MKHIMVDLETMGCTQQSAIISIGAVKFSVDQVNVFELPPVRSEYRDERYFYKNVDLASSIEYGLKADASTILWWLSQEKTAVNIWQQDTASLTSVLSSFLYWSDIQPDDVIWANGITFDISILENAYLAIGITKPWLTKSWSYKQIADLRTLRKFFISKEKENEINSKHVDVYSKRVHHYALHDAVYQAILVQEVLNR